MRIVVASLVLLVCFSTAGLNAQDASKLPDGVIHVALPPGVVTMENVIRDGKPILRLSVDKTIVEAKTIFMGDFKGALEYEATTDGINWKRPSGKGNLMGVKMIEQPGSTSGAEEFLTINRLKAGSVYVTTPSLKFVFGALPPRP
jgi:hypothetical protein